MRHVPQRFVKFRGVLVGMKWGCDVSWLTLQSGLFNSGWPFEMCTSAALPDPRKPFDSVPHVKRLLFIYRAGRWDFVPNCPRHLASSRDSAFLSTWKQSLQYLLHWNSSEGRQITNVSWSFLCMHCIEDTYPCTVKPKMIHPPGKFWLQVTLIQPASFFWLEVTQTSPKR